jgi:hypothetical protein
MAILKVETDIFTNISASSMRLRSVHLKIKQIYVTLYKYLLKVEITNLLYHENIIFRKPRILLSRNLNEFTTICSTYMYMYKGLNHIGLEY